MKRTTVTPAADYRTDAVRVDGWTDERKAVFLLTLAQTGVVSVAARAAEMSVSSAYLLRREARGRVFALGWKAAHLLARDLLEDRLLELALGGVESVVTREEGITRRIALNTGLSMGVLNRLDRRLAALDDREMAVVRSLVSAFDEFLDLVVAGGDAEALADFLIAHPDPLAPQVAQVTPEAHASPERSEAGEPGRTARPVASAKQPPLVENSAVFADDDDDEAGCAAPFHHDTAPPDALADSPARYASAF